MTTECKACIARGKPEYFGSEPGCAFETGSFSGDNWQCVTANEIRGLAEIQDNWRINHHLEKNQNYATISLLGHAVLPAKDGEGRMNAQPVCLWVGWYKSRGRTEGMWLMFENQPPRAPTEEECLSIVEYYKTKGKES